MKNLLSYILLCLLPITVYADHIDPTINKAILATPQNTLRFLKHQKIRYRVKPRYKKTLRKNYLKHYFAPWNNPYLRISEKDILSLEKNQLVYFLKHPGFNENHYPHNTAWVRKLIQNMQLNQYPNHLQKAITINTANLRSLPTVVPSFESRKIAGQGFPFDNLQNSLLPANLPIYVLQTSKDGAWQLVITPFDSQGWVQTKNIASINASRMRDWESKPFVTAIARHAVVANQKGQFFFLTRIGQLFPFVQHGTNYNKILVAVKDSDGEAIIKTARIRKKAIRHWPIAVTANHIARLANHFIGEPYGWGNLYTYRDCSSTTKDLFGAFAIWLPRNSSDQAKTGKWIPFTNLNNAQKQQQIIQKGIPFLTLIHSPGHIMLYVGANAHRAYIFHSPWGLHTKNATTHKQGRDIIGRTVLMPLDLGTNIPNVITKLQSTNGMTYLIPRKYLQTP